MTAPATSQSEAGKRYASKSSTKSSSIAPSDASFVQSEAAQIQLRTPSLLYTLAASTLGAIFIFFGLWIFRLSEDLVAEGETQIIGLLSGRWLAWMICYQVPVICMGILNLRVFCIYGIAPKCLLVDLRQLEQRAEEQQWRRPRVVRCFGMLMHVGNVLVYGMLFYLYLGDEKQHLGLILVHGLGHLLCMIWGETMANLAFPKPLTQRYTSRMGPSTMGVALFGFLGVICGYTAAFRLAGPWIGAFLPSLLSLYELGSVAILVKTFTRDFVQEREVRKVYAAVGADQGILVSSQICMLHAMAEGARMILILAPITHNQAMDSVDFLTPIISTFVWNVMVRAGFLERFLVIATCGWRNCSRCNLLLQKVKYSTGFPRFFVVGAIALARFAAPGRNQVLPEKQETLGYAILCLLLAELAENLVSWILMFLNLQVYPEWRPLSLDQVKVLAAQQLRRRKSEIDFGDLSASTAAVVSANTRGFREECWKLRARFDFLYGQQDWGVLPFWAHVGPVFIAQFHTLLCIIILCNGLHYVLGICHDSYDGMGHALLWWPSMTENICS